MIDNIIDELMSRPGYLLEEMPDAREDGRERGLVGDVLEPPESGAIDIEAVDISRVSSGEPLFGDPGALDGIVRELGIVGGKTKVGDLARQREILLPRAGEWNEEDWDCAAYYMPFHFKPEIWGIYVKEKAVFQIAKEIAWFFDPEQAQGVERLPEQLYRTAFLVLFYHEYYHHKIECAATRFESIKGVPAYRPYFENVYQKTFLQEEPPNKEEALASYESYNRFYRKSQSRHNVPETILKAKREYLKYRFPCSPPGYRDAAKLLSRETNPIEETNSLLDQIARGEVDPEGPLLPWRGKYLGWTKRLSPFVEEEEIPCFLVREKQSKLKPLLEFCEPAIGHKRLKCLMLKWGYKEVPGGKHQIKMVKKGKTVPVPRRKTFAKGMQIQLLKEIGLPKKDLVRRLKEAGC